MPTTRYFDLAGTKTLKDHRFTSFHLGHENSGFWVEDGHMYIQDRNVQYVSSLSLFLKILDVKT